MTQWPTPGNSPQNDGSPDHTIPGSHTNPMTSFANVTMETFDQKEVRTGCMNCHTGAAAADGSATDFIWALPLNAYPSNLGTASAADVHASLRAQAPSAAVKRLIGLLAQGEKDMATSPEDRKAYSEFINGNVPHVAKMKILVVGDGKNSNIILALRGEKPFDGSVYPRMPPGGPFMAEYLIQEIAGWIDARCPQFEKAVASDGGVVEQ